MLSSTSVQLGRLLPRDRRSGRKTSQFYFKNASPSGALTPQLFWLPKVGRVPRVRSSWRVLSKQILKLMINRRRRLFALGPYHRCKFGCQIHCYDTVVTINIQIRRCLWFILSNGGNWLAVPQMLLYGVRTSSVLQYMFLILSPILSYYPEPPILMRFRLYENRGQYPV
jgi:hypothetical protein